MEKVKVICSFQKNAFIVQDLDGTKVTFRNGQPELLTKEFFNRKGGYQLLADKKLEILKEKEPEKVQEVQEIETIIEVEPIIEVEEVEDSLGQDSSEQEKSQVSKNPRRGKKKNE